MKNKQAPLLLAVILSAPAFAFADNIPGHSKAGNSYLTFSEGLVDLQDSQGNSARCNFLSGSTRENGLQTNSIASASFDGGAKSESVNLVDFGANQGPSADKDKGKGPVKRRGRVSGGNGSGVGSGAPSPMVAVAEPGSESLLLFGLAGMGMLLYRRRSLTNAI